VLPAAPPPAVYSLDQCADQYVLALAPRASIVGLSMRATNPDSYLAARAAGLPRRRASVESVLAARPKIVVRYWGGEARMTRALERRGIRVVTIADATSFPAVGGEVRRVAAALGQTQAGEILVARMQAKLAASHGAWGGAGALYLTSGGQTAGKGTLIDAMLAAAGLANLGGGQGFHAVSLERLVLHPPHAIVAGFFDRTSAAGQHWSPGGRRFIARLVARRTLVSLPASILACPAWFAADAPRAIALLPLREKVARVSGSDEGLTRPLAKTSRPLFDRPHDPSSVAFGDTFSRKGRREAGR
jgi:iron complex transport system substrate-binding protein